MLNCRNPLASAKLAIPAAQLAKIALEQRMRIEADALQVGDTVRRIVLEQRAQLVDAPGVQPLKVSELRQLSLERIERVALVVARMDEDRHAPPERDLAETCRLIIEERAAREGQGPHQ